MGLRNVCTCVVYPVVMSLSIASAVWAFAQGYSPGLTGFVVTVGNLAAIGLLEQVLPMRRDANLFADRQTLNDIGHGVLLTAIGRPLGANLSVLLLAGLSGMASEVISKEPTSWPTSWSLPTQMLLAVGIYGFLDYWKHRAYHTFDWLWWIHAIHHDTRQMHVMKAGRLHLLEGTIRFLIVSSPLIAMGAPAEIFIWLGLFMNFEGNLNHSNLDQRFPAWFHYLVPTVQVHHIHHARERRLQDSNFAGGTPLWDVLFGTFSHPDRHPVASFGIDGDPVPEGFAAQLLYPARKWFGRSRSRALPDVDPIR